MSSSAALDWDLLDCPLVGLPAEGRPTTPPIQNHLTELWRGRLHSVWTLSTSASGGSRRSRLRRRQQQEEEGRRRKADRQSGGSGRVKEVS